MTAAGPAGVVLAGGRSRRMGRDKARLRLGGETLVEGAVRRLAAVCPQVVIADGGRGLLAAYASVDDGPGRGPAAGILGAARRCPGRDLLVLACDLPAVPVALLRRLAGQADGDLLLPRHGAVVEPLCARYGPAALAALAARVDRGDLALHRLLDEPGLRIRFVEGPELAAFGDPERLFHNLNAPADLRAVRPG